MSSSTKLMENQLAEYENKARAVCIGVNHLALDTERIKQEELLQRVKELEDQLMDVNYTKTNLPKRASDIRSDVKSNSAALRYLETISQLERSFTVLTDNVSETSVQLSSPKSLPESVLLKKELGGNVQSCWNYVSQLSRLTQVHIRNAAEYHQFHHAATEIEANVNRRVRMTHPDHARALPDELSSAPIMANEYRDHLNHFLHLWGRSGQLLEDSRRVVPVHLRLGGIKNGVNVNTDSSKPVMACTLLSLAGPNYELEEGEEVRIISNSDDQHFWKVQTTSGVADVPSVCLWISDTDREAVKRAIGVRQKCTEGWELLVERMRERLRVFYTRLLNHMADKGDIAYTSKPMMRNFLNDLDHLYPPSDAAGAELKQAADRFTDRLVLVERGQKPNNETILREQDIVSMHSPLLRFRDHENQMDSLNVQSQFTGNDMANYLQEIDADRKRVNDEMAIMNSLQREHQAQLEHLIGRVRKWSSRYDKKFHLELGNQDSYLSPSPQSSVRSDHGWQSEPPIDEPTIMPTVRQTVAAGPRRSPSIIGEERSVVDAVTQIGVQTHNEGVQTLPTQIMSTDMLRQSPRNLKEAVCQIGQVTASTVSQTELSSTRSVPESRSKSYDAIVQVGQIVEDSSVHQLAAEQPTVHPMPVLVQRTSAAPLGNKNSDAIVQVGTILTDAYAQSDPVDEPIVAMQQQPIQQSVPRASVVDTTCHVARDTGSTSVQTQSMDIAPIKTKVNDAVCQIGRITTTASAQTDDYLLPEKKHITQQSTAVCEVGNVTADHQVQTEAEEPILPASSQQLLAQNTPSLVDTAIQIGTITKPKGVQTKPENRPTTQDSDFEWNKPPVQKTTGSHCVQTEAEPPGIDVQAQAGTISTFSEIQTDAEPEKPPGVDVQAQAGTISTFSETQTDAEPDKPRGLDVQAQAGTVSACSEIQTESPRAVDVSYRREIPNTGVSVELQTGIVHNHKEIQAQEEEKILVSPCVVNKQSEVPRRNDNIEVQVGTVSHTVTTQSDQVRSADVSMQMDTVKPHSNVELQTGVICNSKASQISEEVKPRSKSFDVLTQVGVSTQSQASQYSSEPVAKPRVYNAEIQSGVISQPKALQTTDLVTPTKEISLQAVSKPRASNVEAQCGSVSHVVGTQTTEAPVKSVRRYEVEAQAGYVYVSSWTQTKETKQPGRDLALATEQEVKPKGADVETQSGTIKKSVELQTTAEEKIPTPTEDLSVKAERKYADKELQIALQPTTSDVETQAGTCAKSDSVQTQLQTGVQDSRANYEKQVPDVPSINKKLQFTLRRKTEDAQTQHDVVAPKQITSVDDAMLIYQKSVPQNHAQIQTLRPDSGIDSCLEAEEEIKPEVLAPVKAEIPKRDVEAQSGVRTATAFAQTMEEPKPQKVQMNDAEVQMVYQTGYQDYAAQILPVYSAVESQTIAPKKQEVQDTRIACQTQNCDSTMQTDPEVKLTVPTRNTDTQADLKTVKYDVECQSGITVQTSTTQTKPQVVPKVVGKDAQIETMQADASIDSVLETEEPVKIQAVAPVKAAMPMDEAGIQAQILPPRSTVESQTIEPKKQEVQDIYIAHQTQNCDSTMQTHPEVKPAVIANNTATQANYRALGYDVECQSGITAQTSTTQTVPASQCMNIQLQSLAEPVTKTEAGIQTEMLPQMQDTRMTFKKEILDSNVQTDDEVKVPVTVPTLTAEHIVRSDDALVQTELKQPLSDLQCESSVCVQTSATQTKPQVVPKVVGKDAQIETMQADASIDSVLETEEPVKIQAVAPVKAAIPRDEAAIQAEIRPPYSNVESQSGICSKEEFAQTTEPAKPNVGDVRVAYQKSGLDVETQSGIICISDAVQSDVSRLSDASVLYENITPLVNKKLNVALTETTPQTLVNKKLQVALQSPGSDCAFQTEEEAAKELFNVETQAGILSKVASIQTTEEPKKVVPVEDASVLNEKAVLPAINKKLQVLLSPTVLDGACQTDALVRKPSVNVNKKLQVAIGPASQDETVQQDEIKSVDTVGLQAIVHPERFDAETQSGPVVTEKVKTDNRNVEFIAESPQPEVKVVENVQAAAPIPRKDREVQALILPERFDIECQSGTVQVVEANVKQEKPSEQLQNKKLQVALSQPTQDLQYQAVEATPAPASKSDRELQTNIVPQVSDVQLQTGVKSEEGSTQTINEAPPPKMKVQDTQAAFAKAVAPAEMQTEEEQVRVAPVMAAPPVQKHDRQIQAAIAPETFDVQLQSGVKSQEDSIQTMPELPPPKNRLEDLVVSSVLPTTTHGIQADILSSTYDAESQSAILGQEGSTQTKAEPPPLKAEVQDIQAVFAKIAAPVGMQTEEEAVKLAPVLAAVPVQKDDRQIQAVIVPQKADVQLQSGVTCQEGSTQTVAEPPPPPPKAEVHDVQLAFAKAVAPAGMQTEEEAVKLAPVLAAVPVQKDDRQIQAAIVPQKADVQLQSGVTCQEGSTQTVAEPPPPPKGEVRDVQAAFAVPHNSVQLQTTLSPEKHDAELQTGVTSRSKATEACFESLSLESEVQSNVVNKVCSAQTKAEPTLPPKTEVHDVQLAFAKAVAPAGMQTEEEAVKLAPVLAAVPVQKDDRQIQAVIVPQKADVQLQSGVTCQEGSTQTVAEPPPPPPKAEVHDVQLAFAKAVAPAGMQTEEEAVKLAPVLAAVPVQKDDRQIQAVIVPQKADVQLQSGVTCQEGSTQTVAEPPPPPPKAEVHDVQLAFAKAVAPAGMQTEEEAVKLAPVLAAVPVQKDDRQIQAAIVPQKADVQLQSGVTCQEGSTQTVAEPPPPPKGEVRDVQAAFAVPHNSVQLQTTLSPEKHDAELQTGVTSRSKATEACFESLSLESEVQSNVVNKVCSAQTKAEPTLPPKTEVHDVQLAFAKAVAPAGMQTEEEAVKLAPVLAAVPVQKDDRQIQAAIVPQKADVQLQSGVTCQEGSTQTVAEPPPPPKGEVRDVQAAFAVPHNSVQLQTTLSPEKHDAELQTGVTSRSKATEACFESLSLESEVQSNVVNKVCSAQTMAEPPLPKAEWQNVQAAYATPVVATGIQTEEVVNMEEITPTRAAPVISKDNREVQASVESVLGGAQTDAPQSVIRTDVSFTMPAAERSSKNKKLQVNMLTPVESVQVSTQSDTQAPKPSIYDSIVTTVTYSGMGQKPKHHDLLVESKPIVMDSYAQSAIAPTKRTSDVCTQTPKQEKESLIKSVVSFKEAPEKIVKSPEVVAYQKLEMPQKKEPLLLDGAVSFVPGQRNKKLQAILPTDEDTRSIMPEKAACEKKQMSSQTDLEAIEISKVARAIPKIKIDVECQSKVTQIGKKMQFSPSYHEQSNQTESQSFIQTTVYNADSPVVQPTATICASPPIIEQYTSHQQSKVQINKSDSCTQSLPAPLRTQMVTYTTKVLQTQTAVEPPPMVSNYSQSVQQAIKPELNEFVKTEPLKPKKDAAVGVEIAPADKSPYITSQVQLDVPTKETTMQTTDAGTEQHIQVPKRHVRIQKGSSWLDTRLVDDETQIDHDMTDFVVQPQQISNIQVSPPTDMVDANEAYVPPRYSTTVGARPASVTSPAGSLRGSSNGYYRPYRPEAVSWGIQCTPVTLTGVTQTNGYFKSEGETEGRIFTTRVSTTQKSDADVQCNIDTQGDDYFMKRVVTTVSRRGATSTYKRTGPVVRRILPRSRAHVLATSLPSHLDADFFDEDDEDIEGPVTTRKITTTEVEGGGRLVHEELITEEPRERGRSAGARLDFDILDAMEAKSEPNMDAEQCFRNLVNTWGRDYLFERLRHHGSTMSVDRDTAANVQRSSRLVGAKTQYTSCGNIAVAPTSLRNMETQTFISASTQRPPHKNKRIQRGPSCISWTPGQPGMGFSSPTGDEQGPLSQSNIATSYTETVRKQTTLETVPPTTEEYVCPKCGTSARLPLAASMQSQPLPITQLRNERSQTKSSGYFTLDNGGLTLPVYMSDKDVLRINPAQEIYEDPELSSVTWCPADEKSVESRGTSTSTKDEVWIDNPGKLLEVQVTGVTVPGTNKTITASEAFYRGLLRVVYWDYTKAGAREPSELSAAISLADAVLMNNVKLACKRIPASSGQSMDTVESGTSTLDANVVWTAPETHRTRYEVRAVRPEIEHVKEGTGKEYNLASAIEAGYIDRKSGLIVVKPSIFSKDRLPGDDKPEKVFVTDAINRGIVLADLIESDTSYQTPTDPRRTLPMYSPSQMQQDMDI